MTGLLNWYNEQMVQEISIIIPAFNEEENIKKVITDLLEETKKLDLKIEILVIDDASTDGTAMEVVELSKTNHEIKLLTHQKNKGYGGSLKTGISKATFETILIVDADCSYPLESLSLILEPMTTADMVIGARTGADVQIPFFRRPAKSFLRHLASFITETKIPDINSGFRAFRKSGVLKYWNLLPNKFSFTTTITMAMLSDGLEVEFVPINYKKRIGKSKITPFDFWNFLILTLRMAFYFNPLKIILPVSLSLLSLGGVILLYDVLILDNLADTPVFLIQTGVLLGAFGFLADLIVKRRY